MEAVVQYGRDIECARLIGGGRGFDIGLVHGGGAIR